MSLFSKEKGIVLSILNAILILWIIGSFTLGISNLVMFAVKDYSYTYDEYRISYCDMDYDTEEYCNNMYETSKIDQKIMEVEYKRNIINASINILLVSGVLFILNKEKKIIKK